MLPHLRFEDPVTESVAFAALVAHAGECVGAVESWRESPALRDVAERFSDPKSALLLLGKVVDDLLHVTRRQQEIVEAMDDLRHELMRERDDFAAFAEGAFDAAWLRHEFHSPRLTDAERAALLRPYADMRTNDDHLEYLIARDRLPLRLGHILDEAKREEFLSRPDAAEQLPPALVSQGEFDADGYVRVMQAANAVPGAYARAAVWLLDRERDGKLSLPSLDRSDLERFEGYAALARNMAEPLSALLARMDESVPHLLSSNAGGVADSMEYLRFSFERYGEAYRRGGEAVAAGAALIQESLGLPVTSPGRDLGRLTGGARR